MSSVPYLLVLLALAVSSHGFNDLEGALGLLEKLEHEVEEQTEGLKLLIADGKRSLMEHHDLEHRKAVARMEQTTEDILQEAARRKCPEQLNQEIVSLRDSIDDRWQSCMNMTEKLIEFENMTLILYKDYISWRPTFCDTANKVSYCFKTGNIMNQITCAYDGVTGYVEDFNKIRVEMVSAVNQLHNLVVQTINNFKSCFGGAQQEEKKTQLRLLDEGCPKKRGKLITKMS